MSLRVKRAGSLSNQAIALLEQAIADIRSSGEVASTSAVLEVALCTKNNKRYARIRYKDASGKTRFRGCGREGQPKHKAAINSIKRRAAIAQLEESIEAINSMLGSGVLVEIDLVPTRTQGSAIA